MNQKPVDEDEVNIDYKSKKGYFISCPVSSNFILYLIKFHTNKNIDLGDNIFLKE